MSELPKYRIDDVVVSPTGRTEIINKANIGAKGNNLEDRTFGWLCPCTCTEYEPPECSCNRYGAYCGYETCQSYEDD